MEGESGRRGIRRGKSEEEVERMVEAAEDELLLKLSLDSHMAHLSHDQVLPSDLERRFQALKSPKITTPPPKSLRDDGDLFARFNALKATTSSSSPSSASLNKQGGVGPPAKCDDGDEEEDEVEKIIRWAKDAARLDPSPPSDDDDDDADPKELR